MGHYVRIQLKPDWYQRLRGFVVCAVVEANAPSIDAEVCLECYGMCNDVAGYAQFITFFKFHFQSDHLLLEYTTLESFKRKMEVNHLKTLTEIFFYCSSSSPKMFGAVKCAVHMVYENDEERPDPRASIQQSDCDEFQWKGSQSELSETSIENIRTLILRDSDPCVGWQYEGRRSYWVEWTDGRIKYIRSGKPNVFEVENHSGPGGLMGG